MPSPRWAGYAIGIGLILLAWYLTSFTTSLVPGPGPALVYLVTHAEAAARALTLTLIDATGGYAVAALMSFTGLLVCETGEIGEAVVSAVREVLHSVTPVAWALVLLILFGFSSRVVPILVSAFMAFPPLMTSMLEGLRASRARFGDLAEAMGLRGIRRLTYIDLPASVPYFIAGTRTAISVALIASPVAEAFGTAGGIGYGLYIYFELHQYSAFLAWSTLLVIVLILVDYALLRPLERWSSRWLE